jgi:hypothetical protein
MKVMDFERVLLSKDELDEVITLGLKLKLEECRRKNPYFKGRRRGSAAKLGSVKMSRKEKLSLMRFARNIVEGYFAGVREHPGFVSPN